MIMVSDAREKPAAAVFGFLMGFAAAFLVLVLLAGVKDCFGYLSDQLQLCYEYWFVSTPKDQPPRAIPGSSASKVSHQKPWFDSEDDDEEKAHTDVKLQRGEYVSAQEPAPSPETDLRDDECTLVL
jgi:hypothetical protein